MHRLAHLRAGQDAEAELGRPVMSSNLAIAGTRSQADTGERMSSLVTPASLPAPRTRTSGSTRLVGRAAALPDVRAAVEANHDDNRWWPASVPDWRVRMTVAGWSTRVSYAMVSTYAGVVSQRGPPRLGRAHPLNDETLAAWSARSACPRPASATCGHSPASSALPGERSRSGHAHRMST